MNAIEEGISRELRACDQFRWMAGMVAIVDGDRCTVLPSGWVAKVYGPRLEFLTWHDAGLTRLDALPDLSDWPTLGALLGMMPCPSLDVYLKMDGSHETRCDYNTAEDSGVGIGATPGEAIGRALLAHWEAA